MAKPSKPETHVESATERETASATVPPVAQPQYRAPAPPQPRQMHIERSGGRSEPYSRRFPRVIGGTCEYCGVIDGRFPSQDQYKMCAHYRGQQLRCSYCPEFKDPDDIINHSKLEVMEHPFQPGVLIAVCSATECEKKHQERFKLA